MKSKAGKNTAHRTVAGVRAEYKRQHCASMGIGIGPRLHAECPFGSVFDQYNPDNAAALERVIAAAYRQVLGNLHPRESQRETSLEARLLNGEITVRDFVNGLAKSDFYKSNFFHSVGAQRGVELNFKHLLGRAPLNQAEVQDHIKLQAEEGFDALIDKLTDSAEYTEVFGSDIVPYERSHDSYAGMFTRSFNLMRELGGTKVASVTTHKAATAAPSTPLPLLLGKMSNLFLSSATHQSHGLPPNFPNSSTQATILRR
jgi:phycoerythrin-associated linker protein